MDLGVFRRAASRSVTLPVGYRSWTFAHPRGSRPRPGPRVRFGPRWPPLVHVLTPVEFVTPPALPAWEIPLPARCVPPTARRRLSPPVARRSSRLGSRLDGPAVPRRGLPPPRRSASAVSRGPGGLLLPRPCGVFRPLTPMGLVFPVPRGGSGRVGPRTAASGRGGRAFGARSSRSIPCGGGQSRSSVTDRDWDRRFGRSRGRSGSRIPSCVRLAGHRPAYRLPGCPRACLAGADHAARVAPIRCSVRARRGSELPRPVRSGPAPGVAFLVLSRCTARVLPRRATGLARGRTSSAEHASALVGFGPSAQTPAPPLGVPVAHVCRLRPLAVHRPRPGGRFGSPTGGCRPRGLV